MLSVAESMGLKTILEDINDEELFSLLDTVTKRMFTTRFREVAIERILSCLGKPSDLLRRQKVTKKILFNYLIDNGVSVSADIGKSYLVEKCLKLWDSVDYFEEHDFNETETEQKPCNEVVLMGVEFSKWFFQIFNTLDGFGPEHFWPKCSLQAQLYTPAEVKEVSASGANDVAIFLSNLIIIDKFYFQANESRDSIILEEDHHGLVKIVIRGILHQHSNCVGLFDSAFGLVKNPLFENTYKIQLIKLKMQANSSTPGILPPNSHFAICQTVS